MAGIRATTDISLKGLGQFQKVLKADMRGSGSGPFREALNVWAEIYTDFLVNRFDKFSGGGGDWDDLKPRTAIRKGFDWILWETGAMYDDLKASGVRRTRRTKGGVQIALGSATSHPSGGVTFRELIQIHDRGLGRMPQRKIIVPPDRATRLKMREQMGNAIVKAKLGMKSAGSKSK